MARKWLFAGVPMMARLKWYLDPPSPHQLKKRCQSWTPSYKTFWIRVCKGAKLFFVALDKPHGFIYERVMVNHNIYGPRRKKTCLRGFANNKSSVWSAFLLFAYWKHGIYTFPASSTNVLASPGLHFIFNIESGQNVNGQLQHEAILTTVTSHQRQYYVVWQHVMKFFEGCPRGIKHQLISSRDKTKHYWRQCSALTSHRRQYYAVLDMLWGCSHSFIE